jgi:hypothetical protein
MIIMLLQSLLLLVCSQGMAQTDFSPIETGSVPEVIDTSSVAKCDEFFQAHGCTGGASVNARDILIHQTGMGFQTNQGSINSTNRLIERDRTSPTPQASPGGGAPPSGDFSSSSVAGNGAGAEAGSQPGTGQGQGTGQQGMGAGSAGGGMGAAGGMGQAGMGGSGKLHGGLLYNDDEPGNQQAIKAPGENNGGQAAARLNTAQAAIAANQQLDAGSRNPASVNAGGGGVVAGGGLNSGDFGFSDPGGGGGAGGGSNQPSSLLKSMSEAFNGYLNASGLGGLLGTSAATGGRGAGTAGTSGAQAGAKNQKGHNMNPNTLIDAYNKRGLASGPEFGASNTFIWSSMCNHYAAYAAKHRIPYDRNGCGQ